MNGSSAPAESAPAAETANPPDSPPITRPMPVSYWYQHIETGERYYTVQVYSWRSKSNARQGLEELRNKGYAAYVIERENSRGEELCKLRFGKFPTRVDAEKAAAAFSKNEKMDAIVIASNIKISI
jgi:cell division septation protein DedD